MSESQDSSHPPSGVSPFFRRLLSFLWFTVSAFDVCFAYLVYKGKLRGRFADSSRPARVLRKALFFGTPIAVWSIVYFTVSLFAPPWVAVVGGVLAVVALHLIFRHCWRRLLHITRYDSGSAARLRGRSAVFEVFVGKKWTRAKKKRAHKSLREACRWLERQARAHGAHLELVHEPREALLLPDHIRRVDGLAGRFWKEETSQARDSMVGELMPAMERKISGALETMDLGVDNYFLVVHLSRGGVGFAWPASNRLTDSVGLEVAVCSATESAHTYAHEILHLFGARDLYYEMGLVQLSGVFSEGGEYMESVYAEGSRRFKSRFSGALMATGDLELGEVRISALSAHAVGWSRPASERSAEARAYERSVRESIGIILDQTQADPASE